MLILGLYGSIIAGWLMMQGILVKTDGWIFWGAIIAFILFTIMFLFGLDLYVANKIEENNKNKLG